MQLTEEEQLHLWKSTGLGRDSEFSVMLIFMSMVLSGCVNDGLRVHLFLGLMSFQGANRLTARSGAPCMTSTAYLTCCSPIIMPSSWVHWMKSLDALITHAFQMLFCTSSSGISDYHDLYYSCLRVWPWEAHVFALGHHETPGVGQPPLHYFKFLVVVADG